MYTLLHIISHFNIVELPCMLVVLRTPYIIKHEIENFAPTVPLGFGLSIVVEVLEDNFFERHSLV